MSESEASSKESRGLKLKELVRQAFSSFFVPIDRKVALVAVEGLAPQLQSPFDDIARGFAANIRGLVSTVAIPYTLAHASSHDRHYQGFLTAERIRTMMLKRRQGESEAEYEARYDRTAREASSARMEEFVGSLEGRDALIEDTCHFLVRALGDKALAAAADELLLQGVVLCWAALEVVSRESFVAFLNLNPSFIDRLLADLVAKRRFDLSKVPLDTLSAHGFDLSRKMGTVLSEQQDLSDLLSIKAVYEALLPGDAMLTEAFSEPDLRLLSERRHLVVHRRGIVDATYNNKTGTTHVLGERLKVTPGESWRSTSAPVQGPPARFCEP